MFLKLKFYLLLLGCSIVQVRDYRAQRLFVFEFNSSFRRGESDDDRVGDVVLFLLFYLLLRGVDVVMLWIVDL